MLGSMGLRIIKQTPGVLNKGTQPLRKIATENVSVGNAGHDFWGRVPNWAPPIVASTAIGVIAYGFNKQDTDIQSVRTEVQSVRTEMQQNSNRVNDRLDTLADKQSEIAQSVAAMSVKLDMLVDYNMSKKKSEW